MAFFIVRICGRMRRTERLRSVSERQWRPEREDGRSSSSTRLDGEVGEVVTVDQVPHYRFLGTVVAFKPKEQYGFIHSEQMVTNVFFGANHCSAAVRGMKGKMVGKAVGFTVKLKSKLVLGGRGVEVVEEGWGPERLEGRVVEWRREECLLTITKSPPQSSLLGARVWCAAAMCGAAGLKWGKLGTAVTFTLGVAASYRVEAKEARVEVPEVRRVRSSASEGEQLVVVKQVATMEFDAELVAGIATMDAAALTTVFDRQLRQRLAALVHQPVGSGLVTAVIARAAVLQVTKVEDMIARMVTNNFVTCCSSKPGCAVVQACLEKFGQSNKAMIAEQVAEVDGVEELVELWSHGSTVFSSCLGLVEPSLLCSLGLSLAGHLSSLATGYRTFRPLRALLTSLAATDCLAEVLGELEEEVVELACHRFGHTVVVAVVEVAPPATRELLVARFQGRVAELATHPVCCAVVAAVLLAANSCQQAALIEEVCTVTTQQADMAVIALAKDEHGHAIVLAMLQVSRHRQVHNLLKASLLCKQDDFKGNAWAARVLKTIKTEYHNRA